ncbi:MAG TPA: hypothetical protein VLA97_12350, partial [Nocardioidaceae bacterium]|nr:hypothetical protein [Nocardioidaceae bacterium]
QNVLPYLQTARSTGLLTVPYSPAAPFTPVDLADVAAAAATTMADTRHRFATYELCGPELLDTETMAARLAEVLDRPVEAAEQPLEEWQAAADLPEHVRDGLVAMFAYYDRHGLTGSSWTLEQLLGRRPTSFTAAVLRDLPASGG